MTRKEASYILRKFYADGFKSNNYNALEQALQLAVMCLENLPHWISVEFPHWISVEEELPKLIANKLLFDYSDDVLVYLKDGSITVGRWERDNSTGEQYWLLDIEKDLIVTHWMPLPERPKKGGEE